MGKAQQSTLRGKEGLRDVVSARHAGYGRSCLPPIAAEHITSLRQPTCNTLQYGSTTRPASARPETFSAPSRLTQRR